MERKQEGPSQQRWAGILFPISLGFDLHGGVPVSGGAENTSLPQAAGRGQDILGCGGEQELETFLISGTL